MRTTPFDLDRFRRAQSSEAAGVGTALDELFQGRKLTHWIWYIFPQLEGLGSSTMSRRYGLQGIAEARAFFGDPGLRANLFAATEALEGGVDTSPRRLLDTLGAAIDLQKVVSSLTLFRGIAIEESSTAVDAATAEFVARAERLLDAAALEGFPRCPFTLRALAHTTSGPSA